MLQIQHFCDCIFKDHQPIKKLQNLYTLFTTQHCTRDTTKDTEHYIVLSRSLKFDILKLCTIQNELKSTLTPKRR